VRRAFMGATMNMILVGTENWPVRRVIRGYHEKFGTVETLRLIVSSANKDSVYEYCMVAIMTYLLMKLNVYAEMS
jgi:sulfur relay (sulfurtransferase) DsrC/TusE family protein